jgi:CIC family chloride channel protein
MGGLVAAATHAPITAIVIIFELTGDYRIILPLMVTCITATLLATQLQKASIYTMKLLRRGIDLHAGRSLNVLRHIQVSDVMRKEFASVPVNEPLMRLVSRYIESPPESVFVTDDDGRFLGTVTINEIRPILNDLGSLKDLITARDLRQTGDIPVFRPTDRLDTVMHRFGTYRFEAPVVEDGRIVGSIWPEDVIRRYSAELFKREMASGMTMALDNRSRSEPIPGVYGMILGEIPVPHGFVGRSLAEIDVRRRFGVSILLIKKKAGIQEEIVDQLPDAGYIFRESDVILVMGSEEKVRALERAA